MKVIIYGYGQMGKKLVKLFMEQGEEVVGCVSPVFDAPCAVPMLASLKEFNGTCDMVVDFSHPNNLDDILEFAKKTKCKLLLATTGYTNEQIEKIEAISNEVAVFQSYNTSFGVSMLVRLLKMCTKDFYDADFDIEILEKHHHRKIDAPSGTAKLLYQVMEGEVCELEPVYDRSSLHQKREHQEVGIQAIRGGTIFGEHSIYFAGLDEIIEIKHTALSRDVFVTGAYQAAKTLMSKDTGLYTLKNIY